MYPYGSVSVNISLTRYPPLFPSTPPKARGRRGFVDAAYFSRDGLFLGRAFLLGLLFFRHFLFLGVTTGGEDGGNGDQCGFIAVVE